MNTLVSTIPAAGPPATARRPLLITGYWISQMLYAAANLGLADLLDRAPQTCDELANATGAHATSLARLLRALVGAGVLEPLEGGGFKLTPTGEQLRTNDPASVRGFAVMLGGEHYQAWGGLYDAVMTGRPAFDAVFGCNLFEYLDKTPHMAERFHAAMAEVAAKLAPAVLRAYDFSAVSQLVDVGGGTGALLTAILGAHPRLHGVVYDAPAAVERATRRFAEAGLSDRATAVAGNFFDRVPASDAYILRGVIHDWNDDEAIAILTNCRRAVADDGRVLVIEHVIPEGSEPSFSRLQDLDMLVMTGGRERTEAEYRAVFDAAGFAFARAIATPAGVSVLEGIPR
jgi:SAM-dependent methyltransferase